MSDPQVTIVVVPRERFSLTERSLQSIYEHTTSPFKLVYVSAGAPARVKRYLEAEAERRNFQWVCTDSYLSPNKARNLGLREVNSKYVVFLDNDALVTPGWLEALVQCVEETGAWIVAPLYLLGELSLQTIHVAGGFLHMKEQQGKRILYDEQFLEDTPLGEAPQPLRRKPCDYAEFHCMLVRADVFERLGPLDEELFSVHEHIDLCMSVRRAGGEVYFEPKAMMTYVPPPPCEWSDLPFFMLRWNEAWNLASARHFNEKWGVSSVRRLGDESNLELEDTIVRFGRGHRRLVTGLRVSADSSGNRPELPIEEAQLMIAMFQSVDRHYFELTLMTAEESTVKSEPALDPQALLERLPQVMKEAEEKDLNLVVRPLSRDRPNEPFLVRVDGLDCEALSKVQLHAFLTLETGPQQFQCWLAIAKGNRSSAYALRKLIAASGGQGGADNAAHLAGSKMVKREYQVNGGSYPRVRLVEANTGLLKTLGQLEDVMPFLLSCHIC